MTPLQSDNPEPLWLRAAETIREQVSEGALRPGSRLPPERDLCRRLDISRVTLRRALLRLVDDGVLRPSHGRGWYVASDERRDWPNSLESFSETAARMGLIATSVVLRADTAMATLDEAETLGVAPGALLFHLERVRMLDEVPIAIDRSIVPGDLAPGLVGVDFRTESLYTALGAAGLVLANAETTIEAREADTVIAEHLRVAVGKPILVMHQTVLNPADKPLFASTISYVGDRYRLRTSFARS